VPLRRLLKARGDAQWRRFVVQAAGDMIALGRLLMSRRELTLPVWPVRFVWQAGVRRGETKTSHCDISLSISRINNTRRGCARRYSTAGMKREVCKTNWPVARCLVRKAD